MVNRTFLLEFLDLQIPKEELVWLFVHSSLYSGFVPVFFLLVGYKMHIYHTKNKNECSDETHEGAITQFATRIRPIQLY